MTDLILFENDSFGKVRTVLIDGEPWFCLADICKILELEQVSRVKDRLNPKGTRIIDLNMASNKDVGNTLITNKGIRGNPNATFINESNLYKVVFQSRKKEAEQFAAWVTEEVLPSIRKTGKYSLREKDTELYKEVRKKSRITRIKFTDELKARDYKKPYEYIQTTIQMKLGLGINKNIKKDDMTVKQLQAVAAAESIASLILTDETGFHKVNPKCVEASEIVNNLIDNTPGVRELLEVS